MFEDSQLFRIIEFSESVVPWRDLFEDVSDLVDQVGDSLVANAVYDVLV